MYGRIIPTQLTPPIGVVTTVATGLSVPAKVRQSQTNTQHLINYTYMKSSLGRNTTTAQTMVEQTYKQSSLGRGSNTPSVGTSSVGRAVPYANIVKYTYRVPSRGNMSRTAQIIQAAHFGTGVSFPKK
jgi:hypothetical protein